MMPGRPFIPGNKSGRGRPAGSPNKKTLLAKELLDGHAEAITRQALMAALKGDLQMIRTLLPYVLSRPRDLTPAIGPLPVSTAVELSESFGKLMEKVTSGAISPGEASAFANLMERRRHFIETEGFEMRIRVLEEKVAEKSVK
jgi:hypothetical protein